jgi:hypothetical protein
MGPDASWLHTFKCDDKDVYITSYLAIATGIYRFPRWRLHPRRTEMEQHLVSIAQRTFTKLPGIVLWPDEQTSDLQTDQFAHILGVQVVADCSAIPPGAPENVAERLIVIWFQEDCRVIPDPAILPRLQQLPWRQLATQIEYY